MKLIPASQEFAEGPPLRLVGKTYVESDGKRLVYLAGCDYFRFSSHPAILSAIRESLRPGRFNVAASRLTTGNDPLYREAEGRVAKFFDRPTALLVTTGYTTNLVVTQTLASEVTHAFVDERAHVCLTDAARFLNCPAKRFAHRDAAALSRLLRKLPASARPLVLTDGLFARNGAVAPLADYLASLPPQGWLLVDDAHAAGLLGNSGRGSPEFCGVRDERLIQTVTFSKAFGVFGGAVLAASELRARFAGQSQFWAGSTPPPLPLVAGLLAALEVMRQEGGARRERLQANAALLRQKLRESGTAAENYPGPIFPVQVQTDADRESLRRRLLASGIYPSFIRYPGGPAGGNFRFVISSEHTRRQVARLADALAGSQLLG